MPWRVTGAAGAFIGSFLTGYVPVALLLTGDSSPQCSLSLLDRIDTMKERKPSIAAPILHGKTALVKNWFVQ